MGEHNHKHALLDLIPKGDGYNSVYADTLSDVVEYIEQVERQCDELLEAVTDIHKWLSEFTSTDSDPVAYGHYLGLGHLIAMYRQPQEAPELFPGTLEKLRDLGK